MPSRRFLGTFKFVDAPGELLHSSLVTCTGAPTHPCVPAPETAYSSGLTFHPNAVREGFSAIRVPLGKPQLPGNKSDPLGIV